MKPLLIAAALLLVPAAAQAQVAAAAIPNSFDRSATQPRQAAPVPAPAAAAPATAATPANPRSEEVLREIIAGGQAGALPYALMTDDLAAKVREQEAAVLPILQGFGAIQALDFAGSQEGADLFAVTFATAATQWIIGFDESGKVDALLFRPAE
ncbi:MAG: hypothetical protein PSV23_14110 [Brevundimonas sp.]|uniref:hypothetical protein n=1 Tax=Brevundimonas sp. TaxID=1871086 RepID=UPI0024870BBC|nr:hypothetical protein [Brevundimonas sp.]MDI1327920.1 hypothetical protein [Brevundimonas sp.]